MRLEGGEKRVFATREKLGGIDIYAYTYRKVYFFYATFVLPVRIPSCIL